MFRRTKLRKPSWRPATKNLILVGGRRNIHDIKTLAARCNYNVLGILDKHYYGNTDSIDDVPVIGDEEWLLDDSHALAQQWRQHCWFLCTSWWTGRQHVNTQGLNDDHVRRRRIDIMDQAGVKIANLIDPDIFMPNPKTVIMGQGIVIMPGVKIGSHVTIGNHSFVDWDVVISKYTKIGNNCIIGLGSYLAGCVLHNNIRVGVRATIVRDGKKNSDPAHIGDNCILQVGAITMDDLPADHVRTFNHRTMARIDTCQN